MTKEWDANKYTTNFSFVFEYGNALFDLIDFDSVQTALDLGCGNGTHTAKLSEHGIEVVGMDSSQDMVAKARELYPSIEFIQADATEFSLAQPVDLVFSNAVFHWIPAEKQEQMIAHIADALKPGCQLVFEMGGYGNNAFIHAALKKAFANHGQDYECELYFPTIGEYAAMLEKQGLMVKAALLFDRPTLLEGEGGMASWIEMFRSNVLSVFKDENERQAVIDEAVAELKPQLFHDGNWYADYVRLRMKAEKRANISCH